MLIDLSIEINESHVFRLGASSLKITPERLFHESSGEIEATVISFLSHIATLIDFVHEEKHIDSYRMIGRNILIDITQITDSEIRLLNIEYQVKIDAEDFVFFRTDQSNSVGTEKYHDHPELSMDVVQWLISKRINTAGINTFGLGKDKKQGEYDRLLIQDYIFIIQNLDNLSEIPSQTFEVYCFSLGIKNIGAVPDRVVIQIILYNQSGSNVIT